MSYLSITIISCAEIVAELVKLQFALLVPHSRVLVCIQAALLHPQLSASTPGKAAEPIPSAWALKGATRIEFLVHAPAWVQPNGCSHLASVPPKILPPSFIFPCSVSPFIVVMLPFK